MRDAVQYRVQQESTEQDDESQNCRGFQQGERNVHANREFLCRKQWHEREERDHRQVLEQQYGQRRPAVTGLQHFLLRKKLQHEGGRRKREREADRGKRLAGASAG